MKLSKYKGDLAKGKSLIENSQEEKATLSRKLQETDSKSKEFATKEREIWETIKGPLVLRKR